MIGEDRWNNIGLGRRSGRRREQLAPLVVEISENVEKYNPDLFDPNLTEC